MLRPRFRIDTLDVLDPVSLSDSLETVQGDASSFVGFANSYRTGHGMEPGRGYFLLDGHSLRTINNAAGAKHTLSITDGIRTVQVKRLAIVRADLVDFASDGLGRYLVELADERYFWRAVAGNTAYNKRMPEPQPPGDFSKSFDPLRADTEEPPDDVYDRAYFYGAGNAGRFLRRLWSDFSRTSLTIDNEDDLPEISEDWMVHGCSPADLFIAIVDHFRLTFWLTPEGDGAIADKRRIDYDDLVEAAGANLRDSRQQATRTPLPQIVTVYAHSRDYQWYSKRGNVPLVYPTAQDYWFSNPVYSLEFNTDALIDIPEDDETTARRIREDIVQGWTEHIWSTVPYQTNERKGRGDGPESGVDIPDADNSAWLRDHMRDLAERYVDSKWQSRYIDYTLHGCWPDFWPDDGLGGWVCYDTGDGMFTLVTNMVDHFDPSLDPNVPSWDQRLPGPAPPDIQKREPYGREIYCRVIAACEADSSGTGVSCREPSDGETATVPENGLMMVEVLSGHIDTPAKLRWEPRMIRHAWNATGSPISVGRQAFAKWNYQLQHGGAWAVVAVGSSQDWQELCVEDWDGAECYKDPSLITLNKFDMLRMADQEVPLTDCIVDGDPELLELDPDDRQKRSLVIGFEPSRRGDSVLWSGQVPVYFQDLSPDTDFPDNNDTIYWTDAPITVEQTVFCWYKFDTAGEQYWIGAPGGPDQNLNATGTLLMPEVIPVDEPRVLIGVNAAGNTGDAPQPVTQLEFLYERGWTGTLDIRDVLLPPFTGAPNAFPADIKLRFVEGVLVSYWNSNDGFVETTDTIPTPTVADQQCPVEFYNPCLNYETGAEGEPPDPYNPPPMITEPSRGLA